MSKTKLRGHHIIMKSGATMTLYGETWEEALSFVNKDEVALVIDIAKNLESEIEWKHENEPLLMNSMVLQRIQEIKIDRAVYERAQIENLTPKKSNIALPTQGRIIT